ncbi:MAG: 30S ribosomal protein S20 [Deltaproteobacteria bacterium]
MRKNKSAIKRARQSEERRLRNSHVKSTMKTQIKRVVQAMASKDKEHLDILVKGAVSYINKAASKGVIHPNNASRKVSRLSKKVNIFSSAKA